MDSNQLTTIVVTAIVTVLLTEIVQALSTKVKSTSTSSTLKEKLKRMFTANKIQVFLNIAMGLYFAFDLYRRVVSPAPLDRFSVFTIALDTSIIFLSFSRVDAAIGSYLQRKAQRLKQAREQIALLREQTALAEAQNRASLNELIEVLGKMGKVDPEASKTLDKDKPPDKTLDS